MKKFLLLSLAILLAGCAPLTEKEITYEEFRNFPYFHLGDPVPVYDEYEKLSGFMMLAFSEGGSESLVDVYFVNNTNGDLKIKKIEMFSDTSLGYAFLEKNKNLYLADYIQGDNEGHFGCHRFTFKKVKYVKNEFLVTDSKISQNKYAFDIGDAQGQCELYPGPEKVMGNEHLFE